MKTSIFTKWKPISNIPRDLYFLSLCDQFGSLTILLRELGDDKSKRCLKKQFEHTVMYRVTPESSRIKPTDEIPSYDGFWITKQSNLLTWFNDESVGIYNDGDLIHYTICNVDNVIEVITTSDVLASWDGVITP